MKSLLSIVLFKIETICLSHYCQRESLFGNAMVLSNHINNNEY